MMILDSCLLFWATLYTQNTALRCLMFCLRVKNQR